MFGTLAAAFGVAAKAGAEPKSVIPVDAVTAIPATTVFKFVIINFPFGFTPFTHFWVSAVFSFTLHLIKRLGNEKAGVFYKSFSLLYFSSFQQ
jgi:hypothetical protein